MDLTTDSRDVGEGEPVIPQTLPNDTIAALERRLTNDDLVKLKFLGQDWIKRQHWPDIKTFSQFVAHLKNALQANDEILTTVLGELLYIVQRYDLLKLLGSCKHDAAVQERKAVNPYWKEWYDRVERVEVDKVESFNRILLPSLKSCSPEILKELSVPLKELLGDQSVILNEWMNSVAVSEPYYISPVGTYGLCIIINNKNFPEPKVRHGTDIDKDKLKRLFESFDFVVEVKDDLTSAQMQQWIMEVAERNLEQFDCFACWILTHGDEGRIQGVNVADPDSCLNIRQDIIQPFCLNAETLTNKPKMFFINACQGKGKQGVVGSQQRREPEESLQTDSQREEEPEEIETDNAGCSESTLPAICDYLLEMSTILGYETFRSKSKGTWFVEAFIKEFEDYGDKEEIKDVLVRVRNNIARREGFMTEDPDGNKIRCKQISETSLSLRKKLYLRKKRQPEESE